MLMENVDKNLRILKKVKLWSAEYCFASYKKIIKKLMLSHRVPLYNYMA